MLAGLCAALVGLPLPPPLLLGSAACPHLFQDRRFFVRLERRAPRKPLLLFADEVHTCAQVERRSCRGAARRRRGPAPGQRAGLRVAVAGLPQPLRLGQRLARGLAGVRPLAPLPLGRRARAPREGSWRWEAAGAGPATGLAPLAALPSFQHPSITRTLPFFAAIEEILPILKEENVAVYYLSRTSDAEGVDSFVDKMDAASDEPVPVSWRSNITIKSPALYIYTSGTTGATLALRSKFSASQFWDDCRKYNVSVIQYIGEVLCYLCHTPRKDNDRNHRVRIALGNGLRAEVWREFLQRFGDIHIVELYGATESNISFVSYTGKIGAVGRLNYLQKKIMHFDLIKYDVEKDEPVQDENGFCIQVPKGHEGRIGMASIQLREGSKFSEEILYKHVADYLPTYARPHFVRIQDAIGTTGTFKYKKVQLREEGFNPAVIRDTLYFLDDKAKTYIPLTEDIYNSICNNSLKL
ncbi:Very long-chain acyl-CoA synthetase [Varanus komodoensis]|nr:Very long-chain acyl-CoA synthetase [Varanus komodoensis]